MGGLAFGVILWGVLDSWGANCRVGSGREWEEEGEGKGKEKKE